MIIKYFDEFEGVWIDISGATGSTLEYDGSGWTATGEVWRVEGNIRQEIDDDPTLTIFVNNANVTLTPTRVEQGRYNIQADSAIFAPTEGMQFLGNQSTSTEWGMFVMKRVDDYNIEIYTYEKDVLTDGLLDYTSFQFIYKLVP
jgi:hypothetical protein